MAVFPRPRTAVSFDSRLDVATSSMKVALIAPTFHYLPPKIMEVPSFSWPARRKGFRKPGYLSRVYNRGVHGECGSSLGFIEKPEWPIKAVQHAFIKDMDHSAGPSETPPKLAM